MNVIIFGATGGLGRLIVEQALAAGHTVTAFGRNPARLPLTHAALRWAQGDVQDALAVSAAIAGHTAVISALAPTPPATPNLLQTAYRHILDGMHHHGVQRLVATSGAGVTMPQDRPKISDRLIRMMLHLLAGEVLRDSTAAMALVMASDVAWTIARYPRLTDGPPLGRYRVGYVGPESGMQISRADGAAFVLKELTQQAYVREAPVVSY